MFKLSPFLTAYWSYTEYGAFVCCKSAANCQECALRRTKHIQPLRRKYLDLRRGPFTLSSWRKETQLRRKPRCLRAELRHTHTHTQCTHTHTHTAHTHARTVEVAVQTISLRHCCYLISVYLPLCRVLSLQKTSE